MELQRLFPLVHDDISYFVRRMDRTAVGLYAGRRKGYNSAIAFSDNFPLNTSFFSSIIQEGASTCFAIFLPTLVMGNFMVLNLFLALLLNSFNSEELKSKKEVSQVRHLYKFGFRCNFMRESGVSAVLR